jgi:glyoxylase-like metal-dependent hydrolase (beta-lactamase superfamily II)
MHGSAARIRAAAVKRFGEGSRPSVIILTHGHFDHVGALEELADEWDVPVYAHALELPYITGRQSYPAPDPTVGGGAMAVLSFLYPRGPIDIGARAAQLPTDGSVPGLPEWRWLHTPGHAPGHVSLFRDRDRCLIAGDAVITVKQESALAVWTQRPELHGPPMYFTPDWVAAAASTRALAQLDPEILASGHGLPLRGANMRVALDQLAAEFESIAMPESGRYVGSKVDLRRVDRRKADVVALIAGAMLLGATGSALARRGRRR